MWKIVHSRKDHVFVSTGLLLEVYAKLTIFTNILYIKGQCLLKDSDPLSVTVTVIWGNNLDRRLLFSLPADTAEEERKNGYSDCRDQLKACKPSICVFSIKQYGNCIHCLHFNCHIRRIFTKSVLVDSSYFYS